ncbi:hypothetical protein FZC35_02595 [Candidatus Cytomitobacter indipagum]|uniref:YraN family protein n=1 Tax=Candidatus Cytomitobacter indipagum TaxID=2601575 RepID=A0A5C0UEV8_9PROT|nr:YraN family protein [Candidatus Cytomitobacter indipagum]QEK38240.1 hypothetical protein FZC35_02595 [Candidatus Cytomitobacter indipagum]
MIFTTNSYHKGIFYELLSVVILFLRGHKILKWRFKTPVGEIDIISKKGSFVFVNEVKYRKNIENAYHFTESKYQNRLERTYYWWLKSNSKYENCELKIKYIFWHKKFRMRYI